MPTARPGVRAAGDGGTWQSRPHVHYRVARAAAIEGEGTVAIAIARALPIAARCDAVRIALRPAAPLEVAPSLWERAGGLAVGAYAWQRRTCSSALRSIAPCA